MQDNLRIKRHEMRLKLQVLNLSLLLTAKIQELAPHKIRE